MKTLIRLLPKVCFFIVVAALSAQAAAPPGPFFNGFEKDTNGWFDGDDRAIVREPSGYSNGGGYGDGVNSAAGRWHARFPPLTACTQQCDGPFTRWGGYNSTFPPGGYLTQLDIYMDVAWAGTHPDTRFDWISAINKNDGTHLRDFVFNVGTTPTGFVVQSSTNSMRSGANPYSPCPAPNQFNPPNTCRPPASITASGWYTFRHTFRDNAGSLSVDFDIVQRSTGATVAHWTIFSDPSFPMPMSIVGGNRYGWFSNEEIPDLAADNSLRTGLCRRGDGDGDIEDNGSGKKAHFHFHKKTCKDTNDDEDDDVESDDDSGSHFQSTAITAAPFTDDEDARTLTIVGTGLHDGMPVGFTMVAVDNGDLPPGVFTLILSDGYSITGPVTSGGIAIQ